MIKVLGMKMSSMVGNCKYSKRTVFSMHPVKIKRITNGEGGVITTNNYIFIKNN